MVSLSSLPAVNAGLNALSALLLLTGYACIRRKRVLAHKLAMVSAFCVSVAFLASYLYYHYFHGSTVFPGRGLIRGVYLVILISHVILAAAIPPLAVVTIRRAWKQEFPRHVRLARWTLPLWLYVSVTGVVIYWFLYCSPWSVGASP